MYHYVVFAGNSTGVDQFNDELLEAVMGSIVDESSAEIAISG